MEEFSPFDDLGQSEHEILVKSKDIKKVNSAFIESFVIALYNIHRSLDSELYH